MLYIKLNWFLFYSAVVRIVSHCKHSMCGALEVNDVWQKVKKNKNNNIPYVKRRKLMSTSSISCFDFLWSRQIHTFLVLFCTLCTFHSTFLCVLFRYFAYCFFLNGKKKFTFYSLQIQHIHNRKGDNGSL